MLFLISQAAYSSGVYEVARASTQVLWKYFMPDSSKSFEKQLSRPDGELNLNIHDCNQKVLSESNHVLLRHFLQTIFISVDIAIHDGKLYCDSLCDYGTLLPGQVYCLEFIFLKRLHGFLKHSVFPKHFERHHSLLAFFRSYACGNVKKCCSHYESLCG